MNAVLETVYSVPFLTGLMVGIVGQRIVCLMKARYEDEHNPLPGGVKRTIGTISRVWLAGLLTFGIMGYVLFQVDQTETRYRQLATNVAQCQREFQEALVRRSDIAAENDKLSIYQRELLYDWMHNLVFPPPHIAQLPGDHPAREKYAIDLTLATDKAFSSSIDEQRENERRRAENPLPAPTCGV